MRRAAIVARIPAGLRLAAAAALGLGLYVIGYYNEPTFALLTAFWQGAFQLLGLSGFAQALQGGVSGQVTTRSLPAMLSYGLLYTGLCLIILRLVLTQAQAMRLVLLCYGSVFVACAVLIVGGKLAGNVAWAYQLSRRLIDFIISPLPVIILIPLLHWYLASANAANTQRPEPAT